MFGLDPLRLPHIFMAADPSADGGRREIEISREGIAFRRTVRGVSMRLKIPFGEYLGISVRVMAAGTEEPTIFLSLEHRDDALSVLLHASTESEECAIAARRWSRLTGLPILVAGADGKLRNPATLKAHANHRERRKRRSALRQRRSTIRMRAQNTTREIERSVFSGEREIIARN